MCRYKHILLSQECITERNQNLSLRKSQKYNKQKITVIPLKVGTAVAQWLRCCATNRKVASSIPDSVTGIFH